MKNWKKIHGAVTLVATAAVLVAVAVAGLFKQDWPWLWLPAVLVVLSGLVSKLFAKSK